jgi:hypothetical protein
MRPATKQWRFLRNSSLVLEILHLAHDMQITVVADRGGTTRGEQQSATDAL